MPKLPCNISKAQISLEILKVLNRDAHLLSFISFLCMQSRVFGLEILMGYFKFVFEYLCLRYLKGWLSPWEEDTEDLF